MGGQTNLLIEKKEVQQRRLHTKSQPLEQLDKVIEEIIRLMLSSAIEEVNNEKLRRRDPERVPGKKKKKKQQ